MNEDELRRLAEAATKGPWWVQPGLVCAASITPGYETAQTVVVSTDDEEGDKDAAYIAAASPDVILVLLDERERLLTLHDLFEAALPFLRGPSTIGVAEYQRLSDAVSECAKALGVEPIETAP